MRVEGKINIKKGRDSRKGMQKRDIKLEYLISIGTYPPVALNMGK